ncbi:MAG: hypothetical protein ABIB71_01380 [Candidatus Woesearchaeota archaeon]
MKLKILIALLALLALSGSVYAIEGCCELTTDGAYCRYVEGSECPEGSAFVPTACEQTAFCKIGCCFSADEGRCYRNTPRATCVEEGATWDADALCGISQCKKGCCVLGDQAAFITEVQCKHLSEQYPEIEMQFDEVVSSEAECIASVKNMDEGCCVSEDGCFFTTRGSCPAASTEPLAANDTRETGFFEGMLCSNDKLSCGCSKQFTTGCVAEDIYWFDSCGNRENIYDSNRDKSYNSGYVLSEEDSCSLSKASDVTCGNCDYANGLLCGKDEGKVMPVGEYTCIDVNCKSTYEDDISPNADGKRKMNGESWCIYDSMPAFARDKVGSKHYRHLCINGEEIVDECKDFREELCVQGVSGGETLNTVDALRGKFSEADYIESACRDNRWEDCDACNKIDEEVVDKNGEITESILERRQKCCANEYVRDCFWLDVTFGEIDGEEGMCVPQVPPGLKFWGDSDTVASAEKSAGSEAETICAKANKECTVTYRRDGMRRILGETGNVISKIFGMKESKDWHAIKNQECTKREWLVAGSIACKAQGDCGAYYNYLGDLTFDGYSNTLSDEDGFGINVDKLREADIAEWEKKVAKAGDPGVWDDPKWNAVLFSSLASISGGIWGGAAGKAKGEGFFGNFLKGAIPFSGLLTGLGGDSQIGQIFSFASMIPTDTLQSALGGKGKLPKGIEMGSTISQTDMMNMVGKDKWVSRVDECQGGSGGGGGSGGLGKITEQFGGGDSELGDEIKDGLVGDQLGSAEMDEETELALLHSTLGYEDTEDNEDLLTGDVVADLSAITGNAAKDTRADARKCAYDSFTKDINDESKGKFRISGKGQVKPGTVSNIGTAINTYMWLAATVQILNSALKETKDVTYKADCKPWQPPTGGKNCELCNEEMKPCSEYKCRSLGAACKLVNEGTSEEKCVAMDVNDVNSPIIAPMPEVIQPYTYVEETFKGYPGITLNEEVPPFKKVMLGISTNEPAQCRYDIEPGKKYEQKPHIFGTSLYLYNQSVSLVMPSELTSANTTMGRKEGDMYTLYIRCRDANGNENERDYFIRFRVDPTPDMTPPIVLYTTLENYGYVKHNATEIAFGIYVDEPSSCKWSKRDIDYEQMENDFSCKDDMFGQSTMFYGTYECNTVLTDLTVAENAFYIRCKDKPLAAEEERIVNEESYVFTLKGTDALNITSKEPSGTLYSRDATMKVVTRGGAESGNANCAFAAEDVGYDGMMAFFETSVVVHTQPFIGLPKDDYSYYVTCRDAASNDASGVVSFTVDVDEYPPELLSVYVDTFFGLTIDIDEKAECEYLNVEDYEFGEGSPFTSSNEGRTHEATPPADYSLLYVMCKDVFNNTAKYEIYL